ncbi:unnamed protein product [Eruca vesicaria subsp. sativa]|uniref:VIN3-like C-terminal domain-containing protein n=1 Tax=Eruca vesicaria subsp. sativa TaxID=29727 RepID=A0ABC8K6S6_ERUVS|nr:unnamed protein product [Eruca vesicaria subsp. sativa]
MAFEEIVPEKAVSVSNGTNSSNRGFEFGDCVEVLRQLELAGYVDTSFRQKFLTWYGLHANADQKNVVKAFVNKLIKDSPALANQLIFTFSGLI